jgi:dienelactone hydrolase
LKESGTKAVALFPVCYKANLTETIRWTDCYNDVKHIIDDYANKGLIDTTRIYVTGSSDGGRGAWDYAEMHPDVFAAAISMSCSSPRPVSIPVYFFSTASEGDCTARVDELVEQGINIKYKYCPDQKHGGDAIECTPELLKEFFSHTK